MASSTPDYPTCGLYFGSFNPLHIGHVAIANYLVSFTDLDQVRMILSPQNPLKEPQNTHKQILCDRLEHIRSVIAARHLPVTVSDVEFSLPQPLYTIHTLRYLQQTEPHVRFIVVIGADNLAQLPRWYRWEEIARDFEIYVYPREGFDAPTLCREFNNHRFPEAPRGCRLLPAPLITVSSTFVREGLDAGKNMNGFLG